jgi:hypothetical protein
MSIADTQRNRSEMEREYDEFRTLQLVEVCIRNDLSCPDPAQYRRNRHEIDSKVDP